MSAPPAPKPVWKTPQKSSKPVPVPSKALTPRQKRIVVSLTHQTLTAYDGDNEVFHFDCATGDKDHPTMPGRFKIFRKDRKHFSKKYQAQMDYAMFFSSDGKAIHMSHVVGPVSYLKRLGLDLFGSHGCVRLAEEDAKALFDWTPMSTRVEVVRN